MNMNIITMDDANYLAQQSAGKINMILSGMTSLMHDTDAKVETMESQGWFQRMVKTVTGKNKLTQHEIQRNHDKLNAYMSEAIAELYNRNCIDQQIMMSLGTQLNELYADHIHLKKMLGAFIIKLNEKIDSVDNFHMLTTEISQGVYSEQTSLVAICKIMAQYDHRILEDTRKLDILKRSFTSQGIISNENILIPCYLEYIIDVPVDEIGQIYMELGTIRGNYMANIILGMIESYHFLPDMARKIKNKTQLINEVITREGLDATTALSISEIYDDFIGSKIDVINGLIPIADAQMSMKLEEAERLFLDCNFKDAYVIFRSLAEKGNARAMYFMSVSCSFIYTSIINDVFSDNEEEEKTWLEKGVRSGDELCIFRLKLLPLYNSESGEENEIDSETINKIKLLANNGDVFAQFELAAYSALTSNNEELSYWALKAAESGHIIAMSIIGEYFDDDDDLSCEAFKWYKRASEKCEEYTDALFNLGLCYKLGDGVEKDNKKAFKYFLKGALLGCSASQVEVGSCYFYGNGIDTDKVEAISWYKKAALQGNDRGQLNLGYAYSNGEGVPKDHTAAFNWYSKAAQNDNEAAKYNLVIAYYYGHGINIDKSKAMELLDELCENEFELALELKAKINS